MYWYFEAHINEYDFHILDYQFIVLGNTAWMLVRILPSWFLVVFPTLVNNIAIFSAALTKTLELSHSSFYLNPFYLPQATTNPPIKLPSCPFKICLESNHFSVLPWSTSWSNIISLDFCSSQLTIHSVFAFFIPLCLFSIKHPFLYYKSDHFIKVKVKPEYFFVTHGSHVI